VRSLPLLLVACLSLTACGDGSGGRHRPDPARAESAGCPVEATEERKVDTTLPPVVADGLVFAFTSYQPYVLTVLDGGEPRELLSEDLRTAQLLGAVGDDVLVVTDTDPAKTVRRMTATGEVAWEREFPDGGQVSFDETDALVSVVGDPDGAVQLDPETGEEIEREAGPIGDIGLTVEGNMALLYSRTDTRMEFQIDNEDSITHIVTDADKGNPWTFETGDRQSLEICGDYAFVVDQEAATLRVYDVTADDDAPERTVDLAEPPLYPRFIVSAGYLTYQVEGGYAVLTG
jgi:hypothetical protein